MHTHSGARIAARKILLKFHVHEATHNCPHEAKASRKGMMKQMRMKVRFGAARVASQYVYYASIKELSLP